MRRLRRESRRAARSTGAPPGLEAESAVGVYVIEGRAWNEPLVVGTPRRVREYRPGDRFSFPGSGIHRMDHEPGAITIHVYSPPLRAIGHFELEDGELRRRPGNPDRPSTASPQLLAQLDALPRDVLAT